MILYYILFSAESATGHTSFYIYYIDILVHDKNYNL